MSSTPRFSRAVGVLLAGLAVPFLVSPGEAASTPNAGAQFEQLMKDGEIDSVLAAAENRIQQAPDDVQAHLWAARAYTAKIGDPRQLPPVETMGEPVQAPIPEEFYTKAISHFEKAVALEATLTDGWMELIKLHKKAMRFEAIPTAYAGLMKQPLEDEHMQQIQELADSLFSENRHLAALPLYRDLAQLARTDPMLHLLHASCLLKTGAPAKAFEILVETAKRSPDHYETRVKLFEVQVLLRKLDDARATNEALRKADSSRVPLLFDQAMLASVAKDSNAANLWTAYLEKAKGVPTEQEYALCGTAIEKHLRGETPLQIKDYAELFRQFLTHGNHAYALLILEMQQANLGESLLLWQNRREVYTAVLFPDQEWEAFLRCKELASSEPGWVEYYAQNSAWFDLGRNYFHATLWDVALDLFEKMIALGVDDAKIRFHMGRVHHIRGDFTTARKYFEEARDKGEPAVFRLKAQTWLAGAPYGPGPAADGAAVPAAASPAPPSSPASPSPSPDSSPAPTGSGP